MLIKCRQLDSRYIAKAKKQANRKTTPRKLCSTSRHPRFCWDLERTFYETLFEQKKRTKYHKRTIKFETKPKGCFANTYLHISTQRIIWLFDRQETLVVKHILRKNSAHWNDLSHGYYIHPI